MKKCLIMSVIVGIAVNACQVFPPASTTTTAVRFAGPEIVSYNFDSPVNGQFEDYSGNDLFLTVTGGTLSPRGAGNALSIQKNNAVYTEKYYSNFNKSVSKAGKLSILMWVKILDIDRQGFLIYCDGSFTLKIQNGNFIFSPQYPAEATLAPLTTLNEWHHISLVYDTQDVQMYLDGVLSVSKGLISAIGDGNLNDANLKLCPTFFEGNVEAIIDDFKIYNRALSTTEILELFNAGNVGN